MNREYMTDHKGPVCDFCLKPHPRWAFDGPDPDAGLVEAAKRTTLVVDNGVWASCTRCSNLVMRNNAVRLAEVCVEEGTKRMGIPLGPHEAGDYFLNRLAYFRKAIPGLGPRRPMNTKECASEGGVVRGPTQNPSQN